MLCLHQAVSRNKPLVPLPATWLETTQENHATPARQPLSKAVTTWLDSTTASMGT